MKKSLSINVECSFGITETLTQAFVNELELLKNNYDSIRKIELAISEPIHNEYKARITINLAKKAIICYATGICETSILNHTKHSILYGLHDYYLELIQKTNTANAA